MLIASKYEEIYPPIVGDFVYITDKAYSKDEILKMEYSMLIALDFNITVPSSYRFLERFAKVAGADQISFDLARYLIELPLVEYRMIKYSPSNLAASALYLTHKIRKSEGPAWSEVMQSHTGHSENSVRAVAKELCLLLQGVEKSSLQAVKKKFSLPKFNQVAQIRFMQ